MRFLPPLVRRAYLTTTTSIPMDAFARTHSVQVTRKETATSELFTCDYTISPRGLIFHVYSQVLPMDRILEAARASFATVIPEQERLEILLEGEESFDIAPNVFIRIRDLKLDNSVTRNVIQRGLTRLYETLRG